MFIYFGFGVLLAASCRDVYSLQLQTVGNHPNNVGDHLTDTIVLALPGADSLDEEPRSEIYDTAYYGYAREKRAASLAAKIGLAALRQLLRGTKKISIEGRPRRKFMKDGDFESAERDFYSVNPLDVKRYAGGKKLVGSVGDRTLILERKVEKGSPMLYIQKETPGQYNYIDQIIYKKSNK